MRNTGPTEARVRGALLRLTERFGDVDTWPTESVRDEVLRDGEGGDSWSLFEAVQRIGRDVARGKGFNCKPSGWSELDDGIEYTYSRGVFTVRRKPEEKRSIGPKFDEVFGDDPKPDPSMTKAFADLRALDEPQPRPPTTLRQRIEALADGLCTGLDGQPNMAGRFLAEELRRILAESPDNEEPRVTQRHLDMMRHATGGKLAGHRNYCAEPGTDDFTGWTELVGMGLAVVEPGNERSFNLTDTGFRMAYGDTRKPRKRARRG